MSCTTKIDRQALPTFIKKLEFFIHKAIAGEKIPVFDVVSGKIGRYELLGKAKQLAFAELQQSVDFHAYYSDEANELPEHVNRAGMIEYYKKNIAHYQNLLQDSHWQQLVAEFYNSSNIFKNQNLKTTDDGYVDLEDLGDTTEQVTASLGAIDQSAADLNPLDDIGEAVKFIISGLQKKEVDAETGAVKNVDNDDGFGESVNVDYVAFVKRLGADLENHLTGEEILMTLSGKVDEVPEYADLIEYFRPQPDENKQTTMLRIDMIQSFAKAYVPIFQSTIDNGIWKTFETTSNKRELLEKKATENFLLRGFEYRLADGTIDQMASYDETYGTYHITKEDAERIAKLPMAKWEQQVAFLEACGFEFSNATKAAIKADPRLLTGDQDTSRGRKGPAEFMRDTLVEMVNNNIAMTDVISIIKRDRPKTTINPKTRKPDKIFGQSKPIRAIVNLEAKYNGDISVIRTMRNAAGKNQNAQQQHSEITIINKYLSDFKNFPTLQSIYNEVGMFWLNPVENVNIRGSAILDSMFHMDPSDPDTYGQRRRVNKDGAVDPAGTPLVMNIINFNGLSQEGAEQGTANTGYVTTGLNEIDKMLLDMNGLMGTARIKETPRLGDKSTALAMQMPFYITDGKSSKYMVEAAATDTNIFDSKSFKERMLAYFKDIAAMKYLASKGFLEEYKFSSANLANTWGVFESILNSSKYPDSKKALEHLVKEFETLQSVEDATDRAEKYFNGRPGNSPLTAALKGYFEQYTKDVIAKLQPAIDIVGAENISDLINNTNEQGLENTVRFYLANAFALNVESLKLFFGDSVFFKDPHKRLSKSSATGKFCIVDDSTAAAFNNFSNGASIGASTNLASRMFFDRLLAHGDITQEEYARKMEAVKVGRTFGSAVIVDPTFRSVYTDDIHDKVEQLYADKLMSKEEYDLYSKKDAQGNNIGLKAIIDKAYGETGNKEADGQGKCTLDFYRIISLLTSNWTDPQQATYEKIVMWDHHDQLAERETDDAKRLEHIANRSKYELAGEESGNFPPKKFQYSGPLGKSTKEIDGQNYATNIPIFDKFSLQPLIPSILKTVDGNKTSDWHLNQRMMFENIGYVKMETGTKVERRKVNDHMYKGYDPKDPTSRVPHDFNELLEKYKGDTGDKKAASFVSHQELFMGFLKEQVRIDDHVHDNVIFGSQPRKLFFMNLFDMGKGNPRFEELLKQYTSQIDQMLQLEKQAIYEEMGLTNEKGVNIVQDFEKLTRFLKEEIDKKDLDQNAKLALDLLGDKKGLRYNIDGNINSQVLEGVIVSVFNRRIVRYKMNGSMMVQVSTSGNEKAGGLSKARSAEAAKIYGTNGLRNYRVIERNGKKVTADAEVKIGMNKNFRKLYALPHPIDGQPIGTRERLNHLLSVEEDQVPAADFAAIEKFRDTSRSSRRMIAYRIPTQGRNFLDFFEVKEFLPEAFGDAIIMPSEVVIKSGSDFDIDKMFTFYPSMDDNGKRHYDTNANYKEDKKAAMQNRLMDTIHQTLSHPSNYLQLITPSTNYLIEPVIEKIYTKLGLIKEGDQRTPKSYMNTELVNELTNLEKFMSLLKGKKDLGIAAIANTFNAMYQMSGAKTAPEFFKMRGNDFYTYFSITGKNQTGSLTIDPKTGRIKEVQFGGMYDEAGDLKSEFFSEFINAFVDVANDDYVFAINMVTELTPIAFYMKNMGLSTTKILAFINQPVVRDYVKNLRNYLNLSVSNVNAEYIMEGETEIGVRKKALHETLRKMGIDPQELANNKRKGVNRKDLVKAIRTEVDERGPAAFTEDVLMNGVENKDVRLESLTGEKRDNQIMVLYELLNLKSQADAMREVTGVLNFDTTPFSGPFDIYRREAVYKKALAGQTILSPDTVKYLWNDSLIAPINNSETLGKVLGQLMPLRNSPALNSYILDKVTAMRESGVLKTDDDMERFARTFKNDLVQYLVQNNFDKSATGTQWFRDTYDTDKGFNEYLANLCESRSLVDQWNAIKKISDEDGNGLYSEYAKQFPILNNIAVEQGKNNGKLVNFRFLNITNNSAEINARQDDFEKLLNLQSAGNAAMLRKFFQDLALYTVFQSSLNKNDISFSHLVPGEYINRIYQYAMEQVDVNKVVEPDYLKKFTKEFRKNNPGLFGMESTMTAIKDINKRGKWYGPKQIFAEVKSLKNLNDNFHKPPRSLTMSLKNMQSIIRGQKTLTSRNNYIDYTYLQRVVDGDTKRETPVILKLEFNRTLSALDLETKQDKEDWAINEGFESWEDLVQKIEDKKTLTLKPEFLTGDQEVYEYTIKVHATDYVAPTANKKTAGVTDKKLLNRFVSDMTYKTKAGVYDDVLKVAPDNLYTDPDKADYVNHSGGAEGSDIEWERTGKRFGNIKHNHYWMTEKTPHGNVEITAEDTVEGQQKVTAAARQMGRIDPKHQVRDTKLIRNWSQVKYADAVYAVGTILSKGDVMNYGKKALIRQVKGGTGYAVQMAINEGKTVYVFDQKRKEWFKNEAGVWSRSSTPVLTDNFAGIGTREINDAGKQAIKDVYTETFKDTAAAGGKLSLDQKREKLLAEIKNSNNIAELSEIEKQFC